MYSDLLELQSRLTPLVPDDFEELGGTRILTREACRRRREEIRAHCGRGGVYDHNPTYCPYCGELCDNADWVDVGIGEVQCGPFHCEVCRASEQGPGAKDRALSEAEKMTGWYAPGADFDSTANVIGGQLVSHQEALAAYRGLHPLSANDDFRAEMREPDTAAARIAALIADL